MTNNPHNLKVGQKLWFVYRNPRRGESYEATVTKVGNKWAVLDGNRRYKPYRIDLETLRADGGNHMSPGTCYIDREQYEAERLLCTEWSLFYRRLSHSPPPGITLAEIRETAARWGIKLEGSA